MRLFTIIFLIFISYSGFAQIKKIPISQKLYEVYDTDYLTRMQEKSPSTLEWLNFLANNSYTIIKNAIIKPEEKLAKISIDRIDDFNFIKLKNSGIIEIDLEKQTKYLIQGSNTILLVKSMKEIRAQFNASRAIITKKEN